MDGVRERSDREARTVGVVAGAATSVAAVVALSVGVTTPPRTGPTCIAGCLPYPYDGASAYVPGDFVWLVPALAMVAALVVLVLALREALGPERGVAASAAVVAATLALGLLAADYAVQLAVVAPSLLRGEGRDVVVLSMYNPHGVFIALEDAGYLLVALTLGAVAVAVPAGARLATAIRVAGSLAAVATVAALVYFVATLGGNLDYQFEVASIGITWLGCIAVGALMAAWLRLGTQPSALR